MTKPDGNLKAKMDSAVVKYLINNILSVLATEASLLWGVRDAIGDVKDELISIFFSRC